MRKVVVFTMCKEFPSSDSTTHRGQFMKNIPSRHHHMHESRSYTSQISPPNNNFPSYGISRFYDFFPGTFGSRKKANKFDSFLQPKSLRQLEFELFLDRNMKRAQMNRARKNKLVWLCFLGETLKGCITKFRLHEARTVSNVTFYSKETWRRFLIFIPHRKKTRCFEFSYRYETILTSTSRKLTFFLALSMECFHVNFEETL